MKLYKDILNSLTQRGYHVVIMPQLFGVPERDQLYFEAISDGYFKNDVTIISDVYDSDVQQNIIREAQLVIGARYHTIVFAINNQIPFLALSYEHKMYDMLRILNLQDFSVPLNDVLDKKKSFDDIIIMIDEILTGEFSSRIVEAHILANKIAKDCYDEFEKSYLEM